MSKMVDEQFIIRAQPIGLTQATNYRVVSECSTFDEFRHDQILIFNIILLIS